MPGLASEERGTGPAVVLVHGWNGFKESWGSLPGAIAGAGMRAVAVDLPGAGAGPRLPRRRAGPRAMADAVAGLARERGAVALVGHSFGVQIAMLAAAAVPAPRLVLISPVVEPRRRRLPPRRVADLLLLPGVGAALGALAIAWLRRSPERRRAAFLSAVAEPQRLAGAPDMRRLLDRACDRLAVADAVALARWAAAALPLDVRPLAPRLGAPALVVSGALDRVARPEAAAALARALPAGRLLSVPAAAHFPHLERPEAVLPAVVAHLAPPGGGPSA